MTDWINFLPPGETQVSDPVITQMYADVLGCVSFSGVHCVESQEIKLYGFTHEYSERALAKLSGTTKQGNSFTNVFNAILKYGLVKEKDWPTPTQFTWDEFYAEIPPEIIAKGQDFLNQYEVRFLTSGVSLENAPLWTEIGKSGQMTHVVEQLNSGQYFDSYRHTRESFIGQLNIPIINQYQLIIKPKKMSNVQFVHKAGTEEYGFYVPALSMDALKDKALNFGVNILGEDDSIAFNQAKEISGL